MYNTGLIRIFKLVAKIFCCSHRVLRLSSGIDVIGPVMWDLALCLLLAWVIAFLCMVKGIKTTGKVYDFLLAFYSYYICDSLRVDILYS